MKTTALIEKGKDGTFGIFTPDLQHTIIGNGNTVSEAKADFENSINEMKASYTENDKELPTELKDLIIEYKYDLASLFNYYKWINVSKFAETIGISPSLMRQYKSTNQYISENQMAKIEKSLHKIGREIAAIKLI